jgi:hypothetical protein
MNPWAKPHSLLLTALFLGFLAVRAAATTYYVDVNSPDPTPPYTDWSTAATNIQDAVNVTVDGDSVLVTNGVYRYGGVNSAGQTNRVMLTNSITLVGMGGSQATTIFGGMNTECVFMTSNSVLTGFTLTGGNLPGGGSEGGGVFFDGGGVVSNSFIANNSASIGGGVYGNGTVYNSVITNNIASPRNRGMGGGVYNSAVYNSIIISNQSSEGGGACYSRLYNCFILTNSAGYSGSGAYACLLTNCILNGNYGGTFGCATAGCTNYNCTFSGNSGSQGGCADGGVSYDCTFIGNSGGNGGAGDYTTFYNCLLVSNAAYYGGGAYDTALYNCTVVGNTAIHDGGGAFGGLINNSIVYYNTAPTDPNGSYDTTFNSSCSTLDTSNTPSLITNEPAFVNMAAGDFHLQSNSPCINAGNNAYVTTTTDLDGNPRIVGGTVDIGAYEYHAPTSVISYAYLQQYGLPTDGSVDFADLDGTGFNVYQDWVTGLNPTNPVSVLVMLPVATTNTTAGITVSWQSVSGIKYYLQRTTNLPAAFSTIQSNIVGNAGTTSYTDTSATNGVPYFYRVGVQAP